MTAFILLLALGLRLFALNQSLWLDEAVQVWASRHFSFRGLWWHYMPGDFNPPLYHTLIWFWLKLVPVREWLLRFPSLFFALANIFILGKITFELKWPRRRAWLVMLFLALSPLHIYYAQEARMYMLACLGVSLSFWFALRLMNNISWRNAILLGLSFLFMGFSHFLTLFTLPIFFIFLLPEARRHNRKTIFILPFLILGAGYLLYSPLLWRQLVTGWQWQRQFPVWKQTVGSFSLKAGLLLLVKFIIGRISLSPRWLYGLTAVVLIIIYWLIPLAIFVNRLLVKKATLGEKFIAALVIFPPLIGLILSHWLAVFSYFRFLYVLPFWYLLVVGSLGKLGKLGQLGIMGLLGINVICSGIYLFNPRFQRENWRGLVGWLRENNQKPLVIILNQIAKSLDYYGAGHLKICHLGSEADLARCRLGQKLFLVSYGLPIFDPGDKIRKELRHLGYRLKQGKSFRKVGVEKWERKAIHTISR